MKHIFSALLFSIGFLGLAQNNHAYWQQEVDYKMNIEMDVKKFQYKGKQELKYTNNSPDTLTKVYYHLYFNAFQPNSEMDVRSRTIADPDGRVGDRISKLTPSEIGYIKPTVFTQDGSPAKYEIVGTVMQVILNKPILPGTSTVFKMDWDAQVPLQIRRSGRNNEEGVALTMTQWYPKLAEYDFEGWHADPYIGREFYGVWGDFDVTITIDEKFTIGGTGYLQNPAEVGHGYQMSNQKTMKPVKGKYTWHFLAPDVHDFAWAADPDFVHDTFDGPNGVKLHFFYKDDSELAENWKKLQPKTAEIMQFFNENVGVYPYEQYSVIQGGDGGMEYAMCTMITGKREFESLVGVTAHELAHSWFQFVLATNESKHEWMDEGFTSFISDEAMNAVMEKTNPNPHSGSYRGYMFMATSGQEQPLTTHADRYATNRSYGINAYSKGAVFLTQLGYVIGPENLSKTLKRYYSDFKFKHPTPNDFIRTAEKISGFELDWYLMDFTQTTNTIDYGIKSVENDGKNTKVTLERIGLMPMPIDLYVSYEDGTQELFYIPLRMMWGEKPNPFTELNRTVLENWAWAYPTYTFEISNGKKVKNMMIDATNRLADINPENNIYEKK
ncbi:M1 family metallopeptidase [Aequorivita echinoideorum]|uniref:M1 family metallopeptidase n=1 Tax=Aequorivita echinoideorum TaxID=1549647 RepID=A0ABS5S5K2_9FLAO|nr:M1 family metallopeptidase [Aequorivita echinoideorum]MBT0607120.1 M1 family metallopeptidase [Aequorivita echinoideorum]